MNLARNVEVIRISNGVAAGQATTTCTEVDTQGYDGALFIFAIGGITATGTVTCTVRQDTVTGMGTAAALSGASVAYDSDDDNKLAIIDVYKPLERFLDAQVVTATANGVIDGVFCILYKGKKSPITQGATVLETDILASPPEA